jgi:phospholipase A1
MMWLTSLVTIACIAFAFPAYANDPEEPKEPKKKSSREELEQLRNDYQPYAGNIYPHNPIYFAMGTDPEKSKFQVSFRYQFIKGDGELAEERPWVTGFNLAYTQTSFWDLQSKSKPFEDTSYKPEIFYLSPFILAGPKWGKGFQTQTGYRHESNGREGDASRSTNFVYAKLHWIFDLGKNYAILFAPEAYVYVWNDDDTNKDLDKYRGYFDLEFMIAKKDGFSLGTNYQHGTKGWSVRTEFTYPLHRFLTSNIELYLFAQRFDGYAESLLDFRKKKHATRLGFSLVR